MLLFFFINCYLTGNPRPRRRSSQKKKNHFIIKIIIIIINDKYAKQKTKNKIAIRNLKIGKTYKDAAAAIDDKKKKMQKMHKLKQKMKK